MLGSFHAVWGWVAIGLDTAAGLYGVGLAAAKRLPGKVFKAFIGAALTASLLQVAVGVSLYAIGERPGQMHVFYGILTAVALALVYVYRSEMRTRQTALRWAIFSLFLAGLGLRAVMTFTG
jgi:hypothetical protein